jgi:hypothetical protein
VNHRHEQVGEEQQRDNADNDCFHAVLLQPFAKAYIKSAHDKKRDHDSDKD